MRILLKVLKNLIVKVTKQTQNLTKRQIQVKNKVIRLNKTTELKNNKINQIIINKKLRKQIARLKNVHSMIN